MKRWAAKIVCWVCIIGGVLGLLDFMLLMLLKPVLNFGVLFPGVMGAILLAYGCLRLKQPDYRQLISHRGLRMLLMAAIGLGIFSFAVIESMILWSVRIDVPKDVDYVIILGAGLKGEQITLSFQYRLDKGIAYLKQHPSLPVIVTGGRGPGEDITEAEAMERYLLSKGIAKERIIKEDKATSTMENFQYSRRLIAGPWKKDKPSVMIATSDFHMFRSKLLAKRNGFIAYGLPAPTWWGILPNCCIREYFAVIKSFLWDRV